MNLKTVIICFLVLSSPVISYSQVEKIYQQDVSTIENIAEALLISISGGKGQTRDWTRFINLNNFPGIDIQKSLENLKSNLEK